MRQTKTGGGGNVSHLGDHLKSTRDGQFSCEGILYCRSRIWGQHSQTKWISSITRCQDHLTEYHGGCHQQCQDDYEGMDQPEIARDSPKDWLKIRENERRCLFVFLFALFIYPFYLFFSKKKIHTNCIKLWWILLLKRHTSSFLSLLSPS